MYYYCILGIVDAVALCGELDECWDDGILGLGVLPSLTMEAAADGCYENVRWLKDIEVYDMVYRQVFILIGLVDHLTIIVEEVVSD